MGTLNCSHIKVSPSMAQRIQVNAYIINMIYVSRKLGPGGEHTKNIEESPFVYVSRKLGPGGEHTKNIEESSIVYFQSEVWICQSVAACS